MTTRQNTNFQNVNHESKSNKCMNYLDSLDKFQHFLSCSATCFRTHKESGQCDKECEEKLRLKQGTLIEDTTPTMAHVFTTVDTVPMEQLERLNHSEHLKNLLRNPHLRKLIREVQSSRNPSNAMIVAMQEPIFVEFADECMKVVDE